MDTIHFQYQHRKREIRISASTMRKELKESPPSTWEQLVGFSNELEETHKKMNYIYSHKLEVPLILNKIVAILARSKLGTTHLFIRYFKNYSMIK